MAEIGEGTRGWWEARYSAGETPWDTGIVPPELERLIDTISEISGWALDLGCGTGTNSLYLARQGFRVIGIEVAVGALRMSRRRARCQGLAAHFCCADCSDLAFLPSICAVLAIDVGCFHGLAGDQRTHYVHSLACRMIPGGSLLMYAFTRRREDPEATVGLCPDDVAAFSPFFELRTTEHGNYGARPSAWYLFERTSREVLPL